MPRQPHVAVVGRAPKGLHGVRITARANPHRVKLTPTEVAVLESVRDFDRFADIHGRAHANVFADSAPTARSI